MVTLNRGCDMRIKPRSPCRINPKHPQDFHVIDSSSFPFHELNDSTLCTELAGHFKGNFYRKTRGNHIAGYIVAKHRIRANESSLRWTNLEAVFDLPQELFLQILECLHPIDLYHIIRTTKPLRGLLLSNSGLKIWERSFLAYPDIPFYPKDVSAPKWTSLLFATGFCNECGNQIYQIDFTFREHMCCQRKWRLCALDNEKLRESLEQLTSHSVMILDSIPSLVRSSPTDDPIFDPRYSMEEILRKAQEMNVYLEAISSEVPGARESYSKWLEATAAEVAEQRAHALACDSWANRITELCQAEWSASVPAFCDWCQKLLTKRDHDPRDIALGRARLENFMIHTWDRYTFPKLRKRSLGPRLLTLLEETVDVAKSERLFNEHQERVDIRRRLVIEFYTDTVKAHLKPNIAPYLPSISFLFVLPLFKNYVNDPQDTVSDVPAAIATDEIIRFVHSVIQDKKRFLIKLWAAANEDIDIVSPEFPDHWDSPGVLDLATAVFECNWNSRNPYVMVGWEDTGVHNPSCGIRQNSGGIRSGVKSSVYDDLDLQLRFRYSATARRVLEVLAKLINVDLRYARARDLDAMNARFICKTCPFRRKGKAYGLDSMDWRQCLSHTLSGEIWPEYADCRIPKFDVASDALTKSLQFVAQPYPSPGKAAWSCNHCGEHLSDRVLRKEAVAHVRTIHGTHKPEVDRDFFFYRTEQSPERPCMFIGLDANSNHRCLQCPEGRNLLMWVKGDLFKHIRHIHSVEEADLEEGVHWKKVNPVMDETWVHDALRAQHLV